MAVSRAQRMLSLWLSHLATDRIARSRENSGAPLAVYGKRGNADVLTAVDDAAMRLGLHAGLALTQARAMHPALDVVVPTEEVVRVRLVVGVQPLPRA